MIVSRRNISSSRRYIVCLFVIPTFWTSVAAADKSFVEDAEKIAEAYIRCAAVWDFSSEVMAANEKPAAAQFMHDMSNGATTTAYYWLSQADMSAHPGEDPKKLGHWEPYVTAKQDGHLSHLSALSESGGPLEPELELCTKLSEGQSDVIDSLRKGYLLEKDGQ